MSSIQPSSAQPGQALRQIELFESHLPFYFAPKKVYEIFRRAAFQDSASGPGKSLIFQAEPQNTAMTKTVHTAMKEALKLVDQNLPKMKPHERLTVHSFREHLAIFEKMEQSVGSTQSPSPAAPNVKEVVRRIKRPVIASVITAYPNSSMVGLCFLGVGAVSVITGLVTILALPVGLTFLAVSLPFFLMGGGIVVINMIRKRVDTKKFHAATTLDQLVPLFERVNPGIQARLFVKLGPEFREKLCDKVEKRRKNRFFQDTTMRKLTELVNTLESNEVPDNLKAEAFKSLTREKQGLALYAFQNELQYFFAERS